MTLPRRIADLERRLSTQPTVDTAEWIEFAATYVLDSPVLRPFVFEDGPPRTDEAMEALRRESPELWDDPARVAAVREMVETMQQVRQKY